METEDDATVGESDDHNVPEPTSIAMIQMVGTSMRGIPEAELAEEILLKDPSTSI